MNGLEMAESNASNALATFASTPEPSRKRGCSSASAFPASKRQPRLTPMYAQSEESNSPAGSVATIASIES